MSNHARRTIPAAYWRHDPNWGKRSGGGSLRKRSIQQRKTLRFLRGITKALTVGR